MHVQERLNVQESGSPDGRPILFAHGYGCDQTMWRDVVPQFEADFRVIVFDTIGYGHSDASRYDPAEYSSLNRYAVDLLEIVDALDLTDVIVVGHSVSAMIGALATIASPERFAGLIMVCPSPRYINDGDYVGGFAQDDIDDLIGALESNYLGWSKSITPVIMGNADRPELADELHASFCRADPAIARQFARVTFLSDNRDDLRLVSVPTLVVQCEYDAIAPKPVGVFVHQQIPSSKLAVLDVAGHCPNLSAPGQTSQVIRTFVDELAIRT